QPVTDAPSPESSMVYTRTLPADVASRLGRFEVALRCALPREGGRSGTLYIAAGETALVSVQDAVQVLAGQAGLTLDRIGLSREVDRRNSEAYFRTLVLNNRDVILIIDTSGRNRYG